MCQSEGEARLQTAGKDPQLKKLILVACSLGASDAKIISPDVISVEDHLSDLCKPPGCGNYGLSPGCPPHVAGPSGFRDLQKNSVAAVAVRVIAPAAALLSCQRTEIMRLLHEITAGVEQAAVSAGYDNSKAFAGGSCKKIFCDDQPACRLLPDGGPCRYHPDARPSMSGFGINVSELMKACGWPADIHIQGLETDSEPMSWVAGLILIG